jgi:hypothetical protein
MTQLYVNWNSGAVTRITLKWETYHGRTFRTV